MMKWNGKRRQDAHRKTWGQVGLTSRSSEYWGAGGCTWRAAVGVSVRWVSLLPPSLLQPRESPMGCNGIRYSMKPKKRCGVLLAKSWHLEVVQCCSQVLKKCKKKKNTNTKVMAKQKNLKFHLQVEQTACFTLTCLPPAKNKKVHPCAFYQRW